MSFDIFLDRLKISSFTGNRLNKLEAEDTMHALLEFNKGFNGNIEVTTAARLLKI